VGTLRKRMNLPLVRGSALNSVSIRLGVSFRKRRNFRYVAYWDGFSRVEERVDVSFRKRRNFLEPGERDLCDNYRIKERFADLL